VPTLDWMTRGDDIRAAGHVPYRLLEAQPAFDGGDGDPGNMLIQGDNLDALKALLPYYAGRVKCIYIDPPYNTRSAFEHYDDNLEHSQWLAMIYPRLVLLRDLLAEDGSIWVSIDDNEGHYLKVIMDEVFGRRNFVANIVWQKAYTSNQTAKHLSDTHDHLLLYAKAADALVIGKLSRTTVQEASFRNPDGDPRGPWKAENLSAGKFYSAGQFTITGPTGLEFRPPVNRYWRCNQDQYQAWLADDRITFGRARTGRPMLKKFLAEMTQGLTADTWWEHEEAGSNKEASLDLKKLFPGEEVFGTPKPEKLMRRILGLATRRGELILDSFLGSGTTAAVAQKMGRRWIGIEMGDHAVTHCKPRLDKVIEGEQGGVSEAVRWAGGGGYRFYRLGNEVFNADGRIAGGIRFATLAAHIWFSETKTPYVGDASSPLLGIHEGAAYALVYNGILGDRSVNGGNVLTAALLNQLRTDAGGWRGPMTVYGDASRLGAARLKDEGIVFKQIPYDVRAR
jgi:adenine-specific DNA-methyltransferase